MNKATKVAYLPAQRHTRKFLHDLDRQKRNGYLYDLQKQMEKEVPRPAGHWRTQGGKKVWVRYEGP